MFGLIVLGASLGIWLWQFSRFQRAATRLGFAAQQHPFLQRYSRREGELVTELKVGRRVGWVMLVAWWWSRRVVILRVSHTRLGELPLRLQRETTLKKLFQQGSDVQTGDREFDQQWFPTGERDYVLSVLDPGTRNLLLQLGEKDALSFDGRELKLAVNSMSAAALPTFVARVHELARRLFVDRHMVHSRLLTLYRAEQTAAVREQIVAAAALRAPAASQSEEGAADDELAARNTLFEDALVDPSPAVRVHAAAGALRAAAPHLRRGPSPATLTTALDALAEIAGRAGHAEEVRAQAAQAMAMAPGALADQLIAHATTLSCNAANQPAMATAVLRMLLPHIGRDEARRTAVFVAAQAAPLARAELWIALAQLGDDRAERELVAVLDTELEAQRLAARCLADIGGREAVTPLLKLNETTRDPALKQELRTALHAIRSRLGPEQPGALSLLDATESGGLSLTAEAAPAQARKARSDPAG